MNKQLKEKTNNRKLMGKTNNKIKQIEHFLTKRVLSMKYYFQVQMARFLITMDGHIDFH